MSLPPEILDSIHEVELRLVDARRQAGKGPRFAPLAVATLKEKHSRASSECTHLDAIGVLTQKLAVLWGQYREMTRT